MKILFVSGLYPYEWLEELKELSGGGIQNAPNVFQWAVVEGLQNNSVDFEVVTLPFLPAYPLSYKKMYTPLGDVISSGNKVGKMLSYCDLVIYKTYSMRVRLQNYIMEWVKRNVTSGEKLVILTYTPYVPFIQAVIKVKKDFRHIIIATIVTDLVDDLMNFNSNKTILKRIQCEREIKNTKLVYKHIDKYVLLTKPMIEKIPEAADKFIIIEGISAERKLPVKKVDSKTKDLLYTGTLEEFSGIRLLIQAFKKVKNQNYRLIICGRGPLKSMIEKAAQKDSRIIFKGFISREEAIQLQQQATLLINPRSSEGEITRFSFPSKTMEFLSSGTPMLGYKLAGIPEEYYNYYYTIEDSSEECLVETIERNLSLPQEELDIKAQVAFDFIMNNKTSTIQIKKMLEFFNN